MAFGKPNCGWFENVEQLSAKLYVQLLREGNVLEEGRIEIEAAGIRSLFLRASPKVCNAGVDQTGPGALNEVLNLPLVNSDQLDKLGFVAHQIVCISDQF